MKKLLTMLLFLLAVGCASASSTDGDSTTPPGNSTIQGLKSLYMGHSYFRRQADAMPEYAELAGVVDHESTTFFRGGYNGSAFAIWDDAESQKTIKDYLDAGDVQMFGMTIFIEMDVPTTEGSHPDNQLQGLKNWVEYALSKNPKTKFFVALPWLGRPLEYVGDTGDPQTSGYKAYSEAILGSEAGMKTLVDDLRASFPGTEIFLLAYGQGSLELRTLYNKGNLPDVDTLVSDKKKKLVGIHSDTHGHAEQLLTDLNTLVWLESIYGYNVLNFPKTYAYKTDIKKIAHDVATRQDPAYTRKLK